MDNYPGKLIVIDGIDGSGKATQTKLLSDRLKLAGFLVEIADFPQYGKKSAGSVEEYLNGKYGHFDEVGPYRASIFYACDRYSASFQIKKWLEQGKIVISNRYVSSNMGHQGSKIDNPLERKSFYSWLNNLEYGVFGLPKPDLQIILQVSAEAAFKMIDNKELRQYILNDDRDVHEKDFNHLKKAEKTYLEISSMFPNFTLIDCELNGRVMPIQFINNLIYKEVLRLFGDKSHLSPDFKKLHELNYADSKNEHIIHLFSRDYYSLLPGESVIINTGLGFAIPKNYKCVLSSDSNLNRHKIRLVTAEFIPNSELKLKVINQSDEIFYLSPNSKLGNLNFKKLPADID